MSVPRSEAEVKATWNAYYAVQVEKEQIAGSKQQLAVKKQEIAIESQKICEEAKAILGGYVKDLTKMKNTLSPKPVEAAVKVELNNTLKTLVSDIKTLQDSITPNTPSNELKTKFLKFDSEVSAALLYTTVHIKLDDHVKTLQNVKLALANKEIKGKVELNKKLDTLISEIIQVKNAIKLTTSKEILNGASNKVDGNVEAFKLELQKAMTA